MLDYLPKAEIFPKHRSFEPALDSLSRTLPTLSSHPGTRIGRPCKNRNGLSGSDRAQAKAGAAGLMSLSSRAELKFAGSIEFGRVIAMPAECGRRAFGPHSPKKCS